MDSAFAPGAVGGGGEALGTARNRVLSPHTHAHHYRFPCARPRVSFPGGNDRKKTTSHPIRRRPSIQRNYAIPRGGAVNCHSTTIERSLAVFPPECFDKRNQQQQPPFASHNPSSSSSAAAQTLPNFEMNKCNFIVSYKRSRESAD